MTVSSWSWLVLVCKGSWRMGRAVNKGGMDGEVDMVVVVVGSGVGVFLMRRVEAASPRYSGVAPSEDVAGRVLCGNRIFRRDFPDAATIGMRFGIDLSAINRCGDAGLGACM